MTTIQLFLAQRASPARTVSSTSNEAVRRVPLDYPLPEREWYRTADGWASRPWTAETRRAADTTKEVQA